MTSPRSLSSIAIAGRPHPRRRNPNSLARAIDDGELSRRRIDRLERERRRVQLRPCLSVGRVLDGDAVVCRFMLNVPSFKAGQFRVARARISPDLARLRARNSSRGRRAHRPRCTRPSTGKRHRGSSGEFKAAAEAGSARGLPPCFIAVLRRRVDLRMRVSRRGPRAAASTSPGAR